MNDNIEAHISYNKEDTIYDNAKILMWICDLFNIKSIGIFDEDKSNLEKFINDLNDNTRKLIYKTEESFNINFKKETFVHYSISKDSSFSNYENTVDYIYSKLKSECKDTEPKHNLDLKTILNNPTLVDTLCDEDKENIVDEILCNAKYLAYWIEESHPILEEVIEKLKED